MGQESGIGESHKAYLGIDPGQSGAWAIMTPLKEVAAAGLFASADDMGRLEWWIISSGFNLFGCLEQVHAMPRQGVCSTFTFGENYGFWKGFLRAFNVPYILAAPQKWQKLLDTKPGKAPAGANEDDKARARRAAADKAALKGAIVDFVKRRFTGADSHIKLKKDWGKADAICLAYFAMQGDLFK